MISSSSVKIEETKTPNYIKFMHDDTFQLLVPHIFAHPMYSLVLV